MWDDEAVFIGDNRGFQNNRRFLSGFRTDRSSGGAAAVVVAKAVIVVVAAAVGSGGRRIRQWRLCGGLLHYLAHIGGIKFRLQLPRVKEEQDKKERSNDE